jgi:long-chain fatty acid transport protein
MKVFRSLLALGVIASMLLPASSFATNGMFLIGYGAKSRAMGGVGIGYTQDAIGNHMNPAGITSLDIDGARLDMGAMLLYTPRAVTLPDNRTGPTTGDPITYQSGSNLFIIPSMGGIYKFNRKVSLGFSFVGAGGGSTRYTKLAPNGFNFFNPVGRTDVSDTLGVSLFQAQMSMSAAYRINKQHTVAVSPVIGIQTFRAYGLGVFKPFSQFPDQLSNNGNDWSYGAGLRFGWQGKVLDNLTLGAAYTTKIYFTEFDEYRGLFAESGSFDAPANFGLGLALELSDNLTLAFDWQRQFYSEIASINNPIEALNTASGFLGLPGGAGFGWEDQDIFKVGLKYFYNKEWDFSIGYNYGEGQIPSDQLLFSTLAPAVVQKHLTLGTTYKPTKAIEWSVAYVHAFRNNESGLAQSGGQFDRFFPAPDNNNNGQLDDGPGGVDLEMVQDSLELTFTYKM